MKKLAEVKTAQLEDGVYPRLEPQTGNAVGNQQPEALEIRSNGSETCTGITAPRAEANKA